MSKTQKKKQKCLTEEEKRKKNRERMKKARDNKRNNPETYEEEKKKERERYHKRVEAGKIKKVNDLTNREKRTKRKYWRETIKKSRDKKRLIQEAERQSDEISPPPSPQNIVIPIANNPGPHQKDSGKKRARKLRRKLKKENEELKEKLKKLKRENEKLRKRQYRESVATVKKNTPRKTVKRLLEGSKVTPKVRKELIFMEALKVQIRTNYLSRKKLAERQLIIESVAGDVVKKYKCISKVSSVVARCRQKKIERIKQNSRKKLQVTNFFEQDEVSRMCAGKKECITRMKEKKQRRYLTDSMKNLFDKFRKEHPFLKLGYSSFCRFRPFWVLPPPKKRETCLCVQHENMDLIVSKLSQLKIIKPKTSQDLVKSLCCEVLTEECLVRKCQNCKQKTINFNLDPMQKDDTTSYEKWVKKKVTLTIKGQEKVCQKTKKEMFESTKGSLVGILDKTIKPFMNHINNIRHQFDQIKLIKKNLKPVEIMFHIDFSENFQTKYNREVQSAHFGGSKEQLSLHTVVVYYRTSMNSNTEAMSFCTVSDSLRHDPSAICAHLYPIICIMKDKVPNLENVHFVSDGPTTQYRNKKMFFLMVKYIREKLNCKSFHWHYSESGHGKGAPDGVGGCLKRIADTLVAQSIDITDCDTFVKTMSANCQKVKIIAVNQDNIEQIDKEVPDNMDTFKGTLKVHHLTWSESKENILQARSLTCLNCLPHNKCQHYNVGTINIAAATTEIGILLHKTLIAIIA